MSSKIPYPFSTRSSITSFLIERPFEQIKLDIDAQNVPVTLIGYSDYPTHGPTQRPLNITGLVGLFKNVTGYYPRNFEETEKAMIDSNNSGYKKYLKIRNRNLHKMKPIPICKMKND